MILQAETVFYHVDGDVRLFAAGDEAPGEGWSTTPQPAAIERLAREVVELRTLIAKFDPDGDGKPGGGRRKGKA